MNVKKCKALLQTLRKLPFSIFFREPVDPIRDGLPTYLDEIKHPMDLSTMDKKASSGAYKTMAEFASDMELIFANCRQFNPPGTEPCDHADQLERQWRKEWAKVLVPKLEYAEKRSLQGMMSRLKVHPTSLLFREPVDPVKLGIPTYFDIIPKQDARDLSLIESKLKADKYDSIEALDADVRLMLKNCYTFNQADQAIVDLTKNFEREYKKELAQVRGPSAGGTKRKDANTNGDAASASKKAKHA